MSNKKEPNQFGKNITAALAILFIVGGAYELSNDRLGWSMIIIGALILLYMVFGKEYK